MAIFILLTLLISWAAVIPAEGGLLPQGPMIAAFIVLAIVSGRSGVSDLWQRMTRWRVGWKWYLIAPGILIAAHLFAFALSLMLGAQIVNTTHLQSLPVYLGLLVPLILLGGWWEEPGWTGYALRRYQERFPKMPLIAALATGLIRLIWHTPLLLYGSIPWYDFLFVTFALQFIITWLYNRTTGSVLIPMICHLFSNVLFATMYPLFDGVDQGQYWILLTIAEIVIALGIVIMTRGKLGMEPERGTALAFSTDL
jgi:hypothetical protein